MLLINNPNYFEVGQRVIWFYKARPDATDVQKILAEIVKLSFKKVQIKVRKNNSEIVNQWVNSNRLKSFTKI
ncbi:MAG: hypothetical protein V7K69_01325 [Nostoc sp.]